MYVQTLPGHQPNIITWPSKKFRVNGICKSDGVLKEIIDTSYRCSTKIYKMRSNSMIEQLQLLQNDNCPGPTVPSVPWPKPRAGRKPWNSWQLDLLEHSSRKRLPNCFPGKLGLKFWTLTDSYHQLVPIYGHLIFQNGMIRENDKSG